MWVGIGLASFIVLLVILLSVPVGLEVDFNSDATPRTGVRLVWLFGLVRIRLKRRPRRKPAKPGAGRRRVSFLRYVPLMLRRDFLRQVLRLVRDVLRALRFKELFVHARLGLDDVADTGMLFSYIRAVSWCLPPSLRDRVSLEPEFERTTLAGRAHVTASIAPIRLVGPVTRFGLSRPVRRIGGRFIRERWKRKS